MIIIRFFYIINSIILNDNKIKVPEVLEKKFFFDEDDIYNENFFL